MRGLSSIDTLRGNISDSVMGPITLDHHTPSFDSYPQKLSIDLIVNVDR